MAIPHKCYLWAIFVGFTIAPVVAAVPEIPEFQTIQEQFGVPGALAIVTDASLVTDESREPSSLNPPRAALPDFILIQDVHHHPQVQSRIASLILQGYDRWGVKKVFMEGAFTSVDFDVFHRVPKKTQAMLMDRLVKEGDLSGPELAAVQIMEREWRDPPISPFQVFGMEEPGLYRENVMAYRSVIAHRERALEEVDSIRRLQKSMQLPKHHPIAEELNRLEALLRLRITPEDYDAYLKAKSMAPSTPALTPAVKAAEDFYRLAELRSHVFLKEASRKAPASVAPRILVMGGFHTASMATLLRQDKRTFIILSPMIVSDANAMTEALASSKY